MRCSSLFFNTVYPLELGATEAQQTTIKTLRSIPASFKIIFGFVSDAFPLFGYRRKSYMAIGIMVLRVPEPCCLDFPLCLRLGWSFCSLAMALLTFNPRPSIAYISFCYLLFGWGFWWADVMADALVCQKAKLEPEGHFGTIQSTCYALRFFFGMVGVMASTVLYEKAGFLVSIVCK